MQKIRFGLTLDGERGWHPRDALGESTVGPLGMLTVLETQLGLSRLAPSAAERIVQMRGCLEAARTGARFYEKSFQVDEFGTAATLLDWRDQWIEHGWDGSAPTGSHSRLTDMAAIDKIARSQVFPGMGERLTEIASFLASRRPQIDSIELVDPPEEFPLTWQRVLKHLPATPSQGGAASPIAAAGSMLHALQAAVLRMNNREIHHKLPWRDDGTVRLVRAESTLAAAEWLAAQSRSRSTADRVWIIEQAGTVVDAALAAQDQPQLGSSEASAFRPTLQLLPLIARLLWEPLDFKALLQFLTHPVGPIRSFARRTLAEKMAAHPGIGGAAWDEAIGRIAAHYASDGPDVVAEIRFWLEGDRFAARDRAPLGVLHARVDRLAQYFLKNLADPDSVRRASWAAAHAQATAAAHALEALRLQGVQRVGADTLDRLVSHATARGCDNPLLRSEAAADGHARSPGAVIESFAEVCWWHLAAVPLSQPYPWSPRELAQLREMGVSIPPLNQVLERQARGWLRPILAARERLTLVLPGADEEVHPVWLSLSSLLQDPVIYDVERVLTDDAVAPCVMPVAYRPLPQRRRWFQIPAGSIHGWEHSASFSSLDQFFNSPFQWALNYPAQLKPSALFDLPGDFQLKGNLAHRVVEQLYRNAAAVTWNESQVLDWFDHAVDRIVREEGAVLLMAGRRADLESFRLRFRRSLAQLHRCLQSAGATAVEPEKSLLGDTVLGKLRGSSDLLVTLGDGRRAIIDMKWAGNSKYRKKLQDQTHIQLAIYARLVEDNTSAWPAVAYFILRDPELLTTSDGVFPAVTPIVVAGASTALLWDRVSATWRWRRGQIEAGALELVSNELDPTALSTPPSGALPIEEPEQRYNACVHLAGWEADA